ncbi:MAG: hypothetical protein Q4F31_03540 [Eubacteriales bacterium]|nr:hypothetical protein [Eubacteriales bacterium]
MIKFCILLILLFLAINVICIPFAIRDTQTSKVSERSKAFKHSDLYCSDLNF